MKSKKLPDWLPIFLAALALAVIFLALTRRAYVGFFQDDEFDTLSWAISLPMKEYFIGLINPFLDKYNFRPVGHLYFGLMSRAFGLSYPAWAASLFVIHFLNAGLLFVLLRRFEIPRWWALAGAAFFLLSATAFDAYWKPMYAFDLLCMTLSVTSVILYSYRRWVLSFVAFWLAYKSKELAVMLPAVLVVYEYWFGRRKFLVLVPFLAVSLSFGLQALLTNRGQDDDYTFRFGIDSLRRTIPFYANRFLPYPLGGLPLLAVLVVRDRRVWFGLAAMMLLMVPLLFLPGRLFEAYTYLPLACAMVAICAAGSRLNPAWAWLALAIWMPFNARQLRVERDAKMLRDREVRAYFNAAQTWAAQHPAINTLVFDMAPAGFHDWGVAGIWNLVHHTGGLPALYSRSVEGEKALAEERVAFGSWNGARAELSITLRDDAHE